jgi:DNA-binding response OmpR family regulator
MIDADRLDNALGLLSPHDLTEPVEGGRVLICAEGEMRRSAESLAALLDRHGWARVVTDDLDKARWLTTIQNHQVVVLTGASQNWLLNTLSTLRPVTTIPILVVANCNVEFQARLLEIGADMSASANASEKWMLAALTSLIRRASAGAPVFRYLESNELRLDLVSRTATVDDQACDLSPFEFGLLKFLMSYPGVALKHQTIIRAVWGWKYNDDRNALRIHINRLRKKLNDTSAEPRFVRSMRGVGYVFIGPVSQYAYDLSQPASSSDRESRRMTHLSRQLSLGMLQAASFEDAATFLARYVVQYGVADAVGVFARTTDGRSLRLLAQEGMPEAWRTEVEKGVPMRRDFISVDTVMSGRVQHYIDISKVTRKYGSTARLLTEARLPVMLSMPLISRGTVWGALGYSGQTDRTFTALQLMLMEGAGFLLGALGGQFGAGPLEFEAAADAADRITS